MHGSAATIARRPDASNRHRDGSHHRTPALRGRDAELSLIGEQVAGAAAGDGSVVLFDGPAGAGKTRLLHETALMARRNRFLVASAGAADGVPGMPLAPLLGAVLAAEPPLVGADGLADLAIEAAPRFRLVHQLLARIRQAAADQPVLVALDDLHRADGETLGAIRALAAALAGAPVLWALAARTDEAAGESSAGLDALRRGGARGVPLAPLDERAVAAVVAETLGARPTAALTRLAWRSAGNPELLVELLEGLLEDEMVAYGHGAVDLREAGVPSRVRHAMRRRLEALGEGTAEVLRVGSVLGRFSVDQLATMLDASPATLLAPVQQALRTGLLREADGHFAFANDLQREAIVATLPAAMRRSLRRQAAEALLATGAGSVSVAGHLSEGAERGDRAAVRTLRAAARELATADLERAGEVSLRALDLTSHDDAAWGPLVAETVMLLQAALRDDEADALARMALDGTLSPQDEAEVRLALATLSRRPSAARIEHGRAALGLDPIAPGTRARHLAVLAQNLALAGDLAQAERLLAPTREPAAESGDELALASAGLADACLAQARGDQWTLGCAGPPAPASDRTVAGRAALGALQMRRAHALAAAGRLDDALDLAHATVARAQRERHRWLEAHGRASRARLLVQAGDLAGALADAEAVSGLASTARGDRHDFGAALLAGEVALHDGDALRLRAAVRRARDLHDGADADTGRRAARLLALAASAAGEPEEAWSWLARAPAGGADAFGPLAAPLVVRVALAAGHRAPARRAAQQAAAAAQAAPSWRLAGAAAAHAGGLLSQDAGELLSAVEGLRGCDRPLELVDALEDASVALVAAGRRREAEDCAREAGEILERLSAKGRLGDLRRRLRPLGIGRRATSRSRPKEGWESLTEAELDVVRLVADGHTNRQAAGRLVLSPHTVSTHLRHAFAKLGINSRVELARVVVEAELSASVVA